MRYDTSPFGNRFLPFLNRGTRRTEKEASEKDPYRIATDGMQDTGPGSADGSANGVPTTIATDGMQDTGCDSAEGADTQVCPYSMNARIAPTGCDIATRG